MWNKIFIIALAVAVIAAGFFTFYSNSWLNSIGNPALSVENFEIYSNLFWATIWLGSIVLLIIANLVLWTTRRVWAMWATFAFFAVFVLLQTFWLSNALRQFKLDHSIPASEFLISPFFGALLCLVIAAFVYFDQFIVLRLHSNANLSENINIENEETINEFKND